MKQDPIQSDLRVCTSEEPESGKRDQKSFGPGKSKRPETFFQDLSQRASVKKVVSATIDLKLVHFLREVAAAPKRRFVPESCFGMRKDSRKVLL
jgi:hypothetical protein